MKRVGGVTSMYLAEDILVLLCKTLQPLMQDRIGEIMEIHSEI